MIDVVVGRRLYREKQRAFRSGFLSFPTTTQTWFLGKRTDHLHAYNKQLCVLVAHALVLLP